MRKFRFVGDPTEYEWDERPIKFKVYDGDFLWRRNGEIAEIPLQDWFNDEGTDGDWEELSSPLLKDTDLGHFAGFAMQSILHDPNWITEPKDAAKRSVEYAKALIEELNKQQ